MTLRRQWKSPAWLLLPLLLTPIVTAKSSKSDDPADALVKFSPDVADIDDAALAAASRSAGKPKEVGTKDAPIDGRDGKPHAGPWVGKDSDTSKKSSGKTSSSAKEALLPEAVERLRKEGYGDDADKGRIPEKNDGVMDDPGRVGPQKGTTGTEGGVSEKSKKEKAKEERTGKKTSKEPEAPTKELPPLPPEEQKRIKPGKEEENATKDSKDDSGEKTKPKGAVGLEKPTDLPDSPKSKSKSKSSSSAEDTGPYRKGQYLVDTLPYTEGTKPPPSKVGLADPPLSPKSLEDGLIQPFHSFILSLTMILVSEIGDKTFLVAALMAMRHDRLVVFTAAFSALIAMTVLSAVLGHAVPSLLPRKVVSFAAAALFLVFGAKMLREGLAMDKGSGVGEEMREVEAELEEKEAMVAGRRDSTLASLESGRGRAGTGVKRMGVVNLPAPPESPSSDGGDGSRDSSPARGATIKSLVGGLNNLFSLVLSPAWVQTFVMTFLGEWGDRSQIATIAMAAGDDYWFVILGALVGHGICTGGAVLGGRALAGRVSMRVVTLGGAVAFIVFGIIYLVETLYSSS